MSAQIRTLPVWKKGHTTAEWLQELAAIAMESPQHWARAVVVFEELNADGQPVITRQYVYGVKTNQEIIGMLATAQMETFEFMKGRRG